VAPTVWVVRSTVAANADFSAILRWTLENFGSPQTAAYTQTLIAAISNLSAGPEVFGSKLRTELGGDIYTLHVARQGRAGRHFLVFRASNAKGQKVVEILRILHDSMDLQRHLSLH
jgi:toxin ParE1/3/4